ncbi:MAG TPA: hypothetical protein VD905_20975 [Flavobacteriales bacterium]|nr:hypothetical protein [Flavobacteriales bacterium]
MASFTHILNTVSERENVSVNKIQKITFESIGYALARTKANVNISFIEFSAFERGEPQLPGSRFIYTELALNRKPGFENYKALPFLIPFLKEILPLLTTDYVIFTNIDIIPSEHFYNVIDKIMASGHDGIVINRRRVSQKYLEQFDYAALISETGKSHTGYDTFVFKTSLINKFASANVCLGVPPAGNDLFYNLFTLAGNPILFTEKNLTFHIGMDVYKEWGDKKTERENYREFFKILKTLKPQMDISKFPGSELGFIRRHFKWFWNPTFRYPLMFSVDMKQLGKKRKPKKKHEVPGFKQRFLEWLIKHVNFKD